MLITFNFLVVGQFCFIKPTARQFKAVAFKIRGSATVPVIPPGLNWKIPFT